MRNGDLVVCVEEKPERTDPICTPIVKGKRYRVLGARDANLSPPRDPDAPQEIRIVPGDTATDRLGWWYSSRWFKLARGHHEV